LFVNINKHPTRGYKYLGNIPNHIILKHITQFLVFIPLKGVLKRVTGFLGSKVLTPINGKKGRASTPTGCRG